MAFGDDCMEGIAAEFADLSLGETGGVDALTHHGLYSVRRWEEYEEHRREQLRNDPLFRMERRAQMKRANAKRKLKRRGVHLTNAERLSLANDIRRGVKTVREVCAETGVGVTTAERLGQLVLFEEAV